MKKITSLKSLDSFLFDVLTKFFFNSQRFQYCGVKGTFLGTGLNYKKTTFRNEKMRLPIYMRLLAPLLNRVVYNAKEYIEYTLTTMTTKMRF